MLSIFSIELQKATETAASDLKVKKAKRHQRRKIECVQIASAAANKNVSTKINVVHYEHKEFLRKLRVE